PDGSLATRTMLYRCSAAAMPNRCMHWQIIFWTASTDCSRRPVDDAARERRSILRTFRIGKRRQDQREIRVDLFGYFGFKSGFQSEQCCKCDHGRIISAQPRLGTLEFKSFAAARFPQLPAQFLIATDAAAHRNQINTVFLPCRDRLCHQDVDNCLLK